MKILQLGKFYPIRGGVEKVMWDLTKGLAERGECCDMLCAMLPGQQVDWKDSQYLQSRDGLPAFQFSASSHVYCVPAKTKKAATMISPEMIRRLKKIHADYDIIHVHHPDPMACLALKLSGFKGKVVLHWHSDIISQRVWLALYKPLLKWLIKRADVIVGTTPVYLEQSPWLAGVEKPKEVVPIGTAPVPADDEAIRRESERYKGKRIIFSLGRMVPYKGFPYLVEAAKHLPDDYVVLIGGSGPDYPELQETIYAHDLDGKVRLLGYLTDEQTHALFHACTLFVLPSVMKTEAFGIVQIEAMSCHKPVVATLIPESGVSWVNKDGGSGINVPCRDARAIADAICQICKDSETYQKYSEGAYDRYLEYFTYNRMIDQTKSVYEKLFQ